MKSLIILIVCIFLYCASTVPEYSAIKLEWVDIESDAIQLVQHYYKEEPLILNCKPLRVTGKKWIIPDSVLKITLMVSEKCNANPIYIEVSPKEKKVIRIY